MLQTATAYSAFDISIGALVCVTTIFRIATFHNINSYHLTWSYIDTAYWTYSELVLSFICACIPTFRPVIIHCSTTFNKLVSGSSISQWASARSSSRETSNTHPPTTFNRVGLPKQTSQPKRGSDTGIFDQIEDTDFLETMVYAEKDTTDNHDNKAGEHDLEKGTQTPRIDVQFDVSQTANDAGILGANAAVAQRDIFSEVLKKIVVEL